MNLKKGKVYQKIMQDPKSLFLLAWSNKVEQKKKKTKLNINAQKLDCCKLLQRPPIIDQKNI